jgi:hypothetical protein
MYISDSHVLISYVLQKILLEMALTAALADPTVAGAGGEWLIYDEKARTISTTKESLDSLKKKVCNYSAYEGRKLFT